MSALQNRVGAITLFVEDPQRSKQFYQKVFDLPVMYEDQNSAAFKFENIIVNLLITSAAHGLIGPAAVASQDSGSRFELSIWVDDVDAVCTELAARGVELVNGPIDRPWGLRTISFADPDGHIWEYGSPIKK